MGMISTALGALTLLAPASLLLAQAPAAPQNAPEVPDWALPASNTHRQVPPPKDFHRPSRNFNTPIGVFEGQSDIGGPLVPGSATFDPATKQYTINSAGYNIWYQRDEFRFLWKKMSGDAFLAADVSLPNAEGYGDRKAVLVIRQDLDDDSMEAMAGQHGAGMLHLAWRSARGEQLKAAEYRVDGASVKTRAKRIAISKSGDSITMLVSLEGEPLHPSGPPITLHFDGPFYIGIGFCSHLPVTVDTAVISNVVLENAAGGAR
jgi:hypothetical protein